MTEHEKLGTHPATHPSPGQGHCMYLLLPSFINPYSGNRMAEHSGQSIVQN